ncbi:TPA: NAD-binding protein [Pseudomonas aeruginosa]|nr:NAD-binding protein [Pseudomonas aeruginosa]HDY5301063.1 NAD-binding protein [Pseudomonas aeruginosa]HDY5509668.1 NAD-binding protein [Pseudomonas aeruginosa]HED8912880.1 NAD-binding protein [Pseudomonas aeruginosa]HED8914963.1 NAD-binding protein [Pseudomonas aeruginosa]
MTKTSKNRHHVVIIGAGFGGIEVANQLAGAEVDVTIIDRRNHGVVCGRGRNPTLRLWPTIFSGKIDVFPGDRRSRLISSMTSVAPA